MVFYLFNPSLKADLSAVEWVNSNPTLRSACVEASLFTGLDFMTFDLEMWIDDHLDWELISNHSTRCLDSFLCFLQRKSMGNQFLQWILP